MLAICGDDQEIEISGTHDDFRKVRIAILGLLSSSELSATFPSATLDPFPYPRVLSDLIIRRTVGPTLVAATASSLLVSGADDSLALFST